jgi:energy-coupling factor transporter ATP-binding protein EcfA2
MKLRRLKVDGLHGYLDFDLALFPDLTFLIGINGSGKTSAVRAMMALLAPAIRDLARTDFSQIQLEIDGDDGPITIAANRSEEAVVLSASHIDAPLTIPIITQSNYESRQAFDERELAFYRDQEALASSNPVMMTLVKLPTPMFLDLERRAQVGIDRRASVARAVARRHVITPTLLGGTLLESLRDAQVLAEDAYRLALAQQRELADQLKQSLILTHFNIPTGATGFFPFSSPSRDLLRQLKRRKAPINDSLRAIGVQDDALRGTVAPFFDAAIESAEALQGRELTDIISENSPDLDKVSRWFAFQPQLERIEAVNAHVEKYNKAVNEINKPIQNYLTLVNQFLKDSGKSLGFSATADLQVLIEGKKRGRPITALSSGERQLVVILTHLSFNEAARQANVLIIDEPELSLHLRWQEQFVTALQGASAGLQLILATHSPSIIMDREAYCVDVGIRRNDPV